MEYQTKTADSVIVTVAFENELNGTVTFYMIVGYQGSGNVLVVPFGSTKFVFRFKQVTAPRQ